ncbi:hypothetical protein ABL78_6281 [Leptomonas seymouri]|uniref:Mitochondrial RNA binding protein n=1 Tax=Leptomonas seymouri TaxID=5684 RepID=A0A0N1HTY7_LEPSE|nr:hypothetical protein ABL78_6281 [Leptomonas seymouri]|eukprot:KPI84665.1 hypothetical protein ABL78_6281 [Leptomonas seymouri]
MSTPYAAYMRQVTARLQARMHSQSYASMVQRMERCKATPMGCIADARMSELKDLVDQHRRTFDPTFKEKALGILQTLPLKSTDEDPRFKHTFAGLQVCAYFGAVNAPATFNLINHVTRHTFLLDAYSIFKFYLALVKLHHPQTAEIVQILLPRIREVVGGFSISEARLIMEFLAMQKVLDVELARDLVAVMQGGLQDVSIWELARCMASVQLMGSTEVAREFLTAAAPRICRVLQESVAQRHYYKSLYFSEAKDIWLPSSSAAQGDCDSSANAKGTATRASKAQLQAFLLEEQRAAAQLLMALSRTVSYLSWGPRRMLNEMVRTTIAWSEPNTLSPSSPNSLSDEGAAGTGSSSSHVNGVITEAERQKREDYLQALPQLRRHHLGLMLKALHFASHRHLAGLRLLSARIASIEPEVTNAASTLVSDDLPLAIEAVAYFYATDCIPAVISMVDEVLTSQLAPINARITERASSAPSTARLLSREESRTAEVIGLRTLQSCTRLLSACDAVASASDKRCSLPSTRPVDPEMRRELCRQIVSLVLSPLLQLYLEHAQGLGRQGAPLTGNFTRRCLAGAAHVLRSITLLFQFAVEEGEAGDFAARVSAVIDTASLERLRANVWSLTQLVQLVAERHSESLTRGVAAEMRAALEMVQGHPEWLPCA